MNLILKAAWLNQQPPPLPITTKVNTYTLVDNDIAFLEIAQLRKFLLSVQNSQVRRKAVNHINPLELRNRFSEF